LTAPTPAVARMEVAAEDRPADWKAAEGSHCRDQVEIYMR
jgi:hypothetical protein